MRIEQLYSNYSPIGDMISCIICIILLVIISTALYYSRGKNFILLKRALHFIFIGSFLNIIFRELCENYNGMDWLIFVVRDVYHICFMCCIYLFAIYLKKMLGIEGILIGHITVLTRIIFIVCLMLDVASPFTRVGLYKDGDLWYDPMISPYNCFYVYAVVLLFGTLIIFAKQLIRAVRSSLIFTVIVSTIIMIRSARMNVNSFTSFTYVLPILVVLILLHSRPFDESTGALSVDSFDNFINTAIAKKTSFDYMVLKLDMNSLKIIPKELGMVLNSFWKASFKNALLFKLEYDMFVLAIPRVPENGDTKNKIETLINDNFKKYYSKFQIQYKVIGLFDIDFIQSETDVKNMINYLLLTIADNSIVLADDELRAKLMKLRIIKANLEDIEKSNDLDDSRVLVYAQPIMNMLTGEYDTAEALMRLSIDGEIIPPYLFIPLAEYYGHIHALSRIMLNKVCEHARVLEEQGYKFKRISVNFAASEIRSDIFCDEILDIVDANEIDPSYIGIEMTESQNESDFKIVKEKMGKLRDKGMTIYLDDVGTGYSNLDRIVKYDIDVVKFDRFFLLEAEKNQKVVYMMKHLAEAFKDLNYKLLFEGVETDDHNKLCMYCGADYIQGFKYSKPVPISQLTNYFKR